MRFAVCSLLLAFPALAQLDSSTLRAKFGAPLHRETFHLPQGFDLIVDYGPRNQVCKLEMPAEMPPRPGASGPYNPKQQMQDFLAELVPNSMRGQELNRGMKIVGGLSVSHVIYEHVAIFDSDAAGYPRAITVQFRIDSCR